MPPWGNLSEQSDIAIAFAGILEQELGDDAMLTVGNALTSVGEALQGVELRAAVMSFSVANAEGRLAVVTLPAFAERMVRAASDELMLTSAMSPLEAAANKIAEIAEANLEMDPPREADEAALDALLLRTDLTVFPLLAGTDVVACLVVALDEQTTPVETATPAPTPAAMLGVESLGPTLLAEVEMGVTAELGRTEMTVRDLLSLTPGAVIDLDRTAGAPVDVLVNGTPIARGEVVVIDEQFGIRVSEILTNPATS
jgi:flagellar motor switch protein FliN/FliY